jgi:hypothetical protein
MHNAALARLARACASRPEALDFASKIMKKNDNERQVFDVAHPPAKLTQR